MICIQSDCRQYYGVGGGDSLESDAGSSGSSGSSGETPDGGPPPQEEPDAGALPDGGPPAPTCELTFEAPLPSEGSLVEAGAADDNDGDGCGESFELLVALSSNASSVTLFVNDAPLATDTPVDGFVSFSAPLGNRGGIPNVLRARAVAADGSECSATFEHDIFVDCAGPSCSIVSPVATASGHLNASQDIGGDSGLQTDIVVGTEVANAGQTVRLEIDGISGSVDDGLVVDDDGQGRAVVNEVSLAEGQRTVRAECTDELGLTTLSAPAQFDVDLTPCTIAINSIAGGSDPITEENDLSPQAGTQVLATGQVTGGDCKTLRIGTCGGAITFSPLAAGGGGSFAVPVTLLGTTGSVEVCASVEDVAGNFSTEARITANLRLGPPEVTITSPVTGTRYNSLGTAGALPDGDLLSNTCEVALLASCTDVGDPVSLFADGALQDVQSCGAGNSVTLSASLLSKNDGSNTTLTARQIADGFSSIDATVVVQADCEPPALSFAGLACGAQLALAGDDVDLGTPGLQYDIITLNGGIPDVTLTVARGGLETDIGATGGGAATAFPAVDLGGAGSVSLTACATDPQGNQGCTASCSFTIAAEPDVAITSPAASTVLSTLTADCNPGVPGLQVTVQGTTSAADGSSVLVALGLGALASASTTLGTFTACVDAADGNNQPLVASVTDAATGLEGASAISVSVDTVAPSSTVAAPSFTLASRRAGDGQLDWTSIVDSGGAALRAYRLRCSAADITSELDWAAATELELATEPSETAGSPESELVDGLAKPGMSRFCVLRGEDAGGQLSPISAGNSVELSNPFRVQQYSVTDTPTQNVALDPLGDINGDGIADFAYGVVNAGVEVFLGSTDLDTSAVDVKAPSFVIRNTGAVGATLGFGSEVAGLGDINGDSIPDFATSARGANAVFVFFGRASNTWTDINLTALSPCPADLCILGAGTGGAGLLGWDITSANFDGAGPLDLIISGRSITSTQTNAGRVYVLLGGAQLATPGTTITLPASNPNGFIIDPPALRTNFGVSIGAVTGAGSVDDLVIGANGGLASTPSPATATANRITGRAHVGTGLTTLNPTNEFENGPLGNYGNPVRALGDFNGDGRGDLMVGRNVNQGGIANIYLGLVGGGFNNQAGNLLTFSNELFPTLDDNYGQFAAHSFHPGLGALGDLDQDGLTEILLGSTTPDVGTKGLAHLFYGSTAATSRSRGSADFTYTPQNTQVVPNFVGDINQDGFPDFALLDSGTGANVIFLMY